MSTNRFIYSIDNKRYHTLNYHYIKTFGQKLHKAVIDASFSCPNKDGTCGNGGCSFCLSGSGEFTQDKNLSITRQLELENERITKKHGASRLIAYFQANTNTYAPVKTLEKVYAEALLFPNVSGISIGTRPDCINKENVKLLSSLSKNTYLTVELGLQTVHDKTAKKFNRGYCYDTFLKAYDMLKHEKIRVCVHMINGLYDETRDDMVETAKKVGKLYPDAVKIHLLHILKGTQAEKDLNCGKITPLSKSSYVDTVCRQLEVLPPTCVIERLTGDGNKENLVAPLWSQDKISTLAQIDKELSARSTYQGEFFADFS